MSLLDSTVAAPRPDGLSRLLALGIDYMDAETANAEVLRLTALLLRLEARIERQIILFDEVGL